MTSSAPINITVPKAQENTLASSSPTQRKFLDIVDLSSNGFEVKISENNMDEIYVKFDIDPAKYPQLNLSSELCPYVGGVWWLRIELPERYPQASPSVGFVNRIFHPNVDELSGSICLDVLNQTWSPMFTLTHAMTNFLTQLLCYPNPHDPMNRAAAAALLQDEGKFKEMVKQHTQTYASHDRAQEAIDKETEGRNFYDPDIDAIKKKKLKGKSLPEPASMQVDKKEEEDDVSSASDIDLDGDDLDIE